MSRHSKNPNHNPSPDSYRDEPSRRSRVAKRVASVAVWVALGSGLGLAGSGALAVHQDRKADEAYALADTEALAGNTDASNQAKRDAEYHTKFSKAGLAGAVTTSVAVIAATTVAAVAKHIENPPFPDDPPQAEAPQRPPEGPPQPASGYTADTQIVPGGQQPADHPHLIPPDWKNPI